MDHKKMLGQVEALARKAVEAHDAGDALDFAKAASELAHAHAAIRRSLAEFGE